MNVKRPAGSRIKFSGWGGAIWLFHISLQRCTGIRVLVLSITKDSDDKLHVLSAESSANILEKKIVELSVGKKQHLSSIFSLSPSFQSQESILHSHSCRNALQPYGRVKEVRKLTCLNNALNDSEHYSMSTFLAVLADFHFCFSFFRASETTGRNIKTHFFFVPDSEKKIWDLLVA